MFPITQPAVWDMYKKAQVRAARLHAGAFARRARAMLTPASARVVQASFWSAEEIDLSADLKHWTELTENERFFIGRVLVRVCRASSRTAGAA